MGVLKTLGNLACSGSQAQTATSEAKADTTRVKGATETLKVADFVDKQAHPGETWLMTVAKWDGNLAFSKDRLLANAYLPDSLVSGGARDSARTQLVRRLPLPGFYAALDTAAVVESADKLAETVRAAKDNYGRVKFFLLEGHGQPKSVALQEGERSEASPNLPNDLYADSTGMNDAQKGAWKKIADLKDCFAPEAVVVMKSCSAGQGDSSVAATLSRMWGVHVFAPGWVACEQPGQEANGQWTIGRWDSSWSPPRDTMNHFYKGELVGSKKPDPK